MSRTLVILILFAICFDVKAQEDEDLTVIGLPHDQKITTKATSIPEMAMVDESKKLSDPADHLTRWFYTRAGEKVLAQ